MAQKNVEVNVKTPSGYDQLNFKTTATQVLMSNGDTVENNVPRILTHSKDGTIHNFTGSVPISGTVIGMAMTTADFDDGDTIRINNTTYTITDILGDSISGFKSGLPISMVINVNTRKLTIGGATSKQFQQFTMPVSYESSGTGGEWIETNIPTGNALLISAVVVGTKVYGSDNPYNSIVERDLNTNAYKKYSFPAINNFRFLSFDKYNNELYAWGTAESTTPYKLMLYKANLGTLTWSSIAEYVIDTTARPDQFGYVCKPDSESAFIFCSNSLSEELCIVQFNNTSKEFRIILNRLNQGRIFSSKGFSYMTTDGGGFRVNFGCVSINSEGSYIIKLYIFISGPGSFIPNGEIPLSGNPGQLQGVKVGNRVVWSSYNALNGVYSGYIDVTNKIISYEGVPTPQAKANIQNFFEYNNQWIQYAANKKYSLQLQEIAPEQNPIVLRIFKGQYYSSPHAKIIVRAVAAWSQPQIIFDGTERQATRDLKIPLGSYEQLTPTTINVWRD